MAQSRSERNPRTASPPAASRCARYAVRGLVVAGFVGVAWLLSASAAHASNGSDASERQPAPAGGLLAPVTGLLAGAGTDAGSHTADQHQALQHRPARPRPGLDHQRGDLLTSTVFTLLSPVAAPAGKAAASVTVHRTVYPKQGLVQTVDRAARSATADASGARFASTKRPAKAGIVRTDPKRTQEPAVQAVPVRDGSTGDMTVAATGSLIAGVDPAVAAGRAADRLHAALRTAEDRGGSHAKPVADRTVAQGTHHVPLLPRPAPVPVPPAAGLTSGAPSTGSGFNHDGGAAVALPAAPAGTKVLTFRPVTVEDVELRLLAAEKPTVSPD
ncbi:hypothetical protein ABT297_19790 [Dactylosporangium sp. NPDC000555]|uniref:hypothetical protein n=1 Tax=Dactylosporangium sp. NPDC000555 TaxID=3154260 RepID=UPI003322321C